MGEISFVCVCPSPLQQASKYNFSNLGTVSDFRNKHIIYILVFLFFYFFHGEMHLQLHF